MAFSEPFQALVLAFAVMVVTIDLWTDGDHRQRMATEHRAWWDRLRSATYSRLMSDAACGFYGLPAIKIAEGRSRLFHIVIAFVAIGLIGASFLVAGALLFAPDPKAVFSHVLNFFVAPSAVVVLFWLTAVAGLLSRIARVPFAPQQVFLFFILAAGAILMWSALMHMGTWMEWQHKRTATGYGTEWFYAEVYMEYIRETVGRLVTLTAALIVGLPAAPCVLRICFSAGCKVLRPVLEPLLGHLIGGISKARRGVLGVFALLIALLAGVLGA